MKLKLIYKILVIFIFTFSFAFSAKDKYPISLKFKEEYQGAKYIKANLNYLFKRNWSTEFTTFSFWEGQTKKNVVTTYLENVEIFDWSICKNENLSDLFFLIRENSKFIIKTNLNTNNTKNVNLINFFVFDEESVNSISNIETYKVQSINVKLLLVLINSKLYLIDKVTKKIISKIENVNSFTVISENGIDNLYFQKDLGTFSGIYKYQNNLENKLISKVECNESKCKLLSIGNSFLVSINEFSQNIFIKTIDLHSNNEQNIWIDTKINWLAPKDKNEDLFYLTNLDSNFTYLTRENDYYQIIQTNIINFSNFSKQKRFKLPEALIEPICLQSSKDETIAVFKNGLIILEKDFNITSYKIYPPLGDKISSDVYVNNYFDKLILSSKVGTIIFSKEKNNLWWLYKFMDNQGYYTIPFVFFLVILIFIQLYLRQRRLLNTIIQLPNTGFVLYFDKSGHLIKLNDLAMNILNITPSVPLNKYFAFYCSNEEVKPLLQIFEKGIDFRENFNQKISIIKDNNLKEYFCSIVVLRGITGNLSGLLITGLDITEELERKRLSNWAQLAHDMQTNLSTIRLNAEQMEFDDSSPDYIRRRKILHQSNLLIQRIRDIITVGRSESLNKTPIFSLDIMEEIKSDFDFDLYKNIEFEFNSSNFPLVCDKAKLSRALRNALENSIKIIKESNGIISINAWYDTRYIYFSVKDNGPGMSLVVKEKMTTPFFTSGTGGTGIGTMIMQNVAVQHGGEIIINSEIGKGTEVIFKLPNANYRDKLSNE
ncbi:MAG: HAMP domain-containing sensor histidine kinase [Candidatus Kapabacteria bacterium]|nr:HAMP domain-containing sensor histidine kinase [Candidatus Kapabacteria bacterium]